MKNSRGFSGPTLCLMEKVEAKLVDVKRRPGGYVPGIAVSRAMYHQMRCDFTSSAGIDGSEPLLAGPFRIAGCLLREDNSVKGFDFRIDLDIVTTVADRERLAFC